MDSRGYSLLEVMISMVVLAIAFLALIATQLGSLSGYVSARDATAAAEIGRRTSEILRIQGSQWVQNTVPDPPGPPTFVGEAPYDPSPFDTTDTIQAIIGATPAWVPLVDTPVDGRFNRSGVTPNHLGGKFCIYARGAPMASMFEDLGGNDVVAAIRFQIAVVYPGPRATLNDCTGSGPVTPALLAVVGNSAGTIPGLETIGMRVAYFGTIVVRHAHLTNFASGAQ